ncbi:MAG: MFS transporter, partial [Bowdeniella nasicola]|nr:MFS transporter [Bowdeniella nasicola]
SCGNRETGGTPLESTTVFGDNRPVNTQGEVTMQPPETAAFERRLLWLSVLLITVGAFEALALTTVMPVVSRDLDGAKLYALALGVPLATHVISTTFAGRWVDARGPYYPILTGCGLAAAGLCVAGFAHVMELVALGRAIMGLGTGLLMVSLYAMVGGLIPVKKQPMFFAVFAAAWVVPSMFGPYFAGVIAEIWSWRIVFVGVVPLLIFAIAAMIPLLRPVPRTHDKLWTNKKQPLMLLFAIGAGAGAALMQVVTAGRNLLAAFVFVLTAAGVLYLLHLLLPPGTLSARRNQVGAAIATRMWTNAGVVATEAFLPLMLVQVHGWSEKSAGIVLAIGGITWGIGSVIQGRIHTQAIRERLPVIGGMLATCGVGLAAFSSLSFIPPITTAIAWVLAGLGIGLTLPAMSVVALAVTPKAEHGSISASLQIVDGIGAALAIGIVGFFQMVPHLELWPGSGNGNPFVFGLVCMAGLCALSTFTARRVPRVETEL